MCHRHLKSSHWVIELSDLIDNESQVTAVILHALSVLPPILHSLLQLHCQLAAAFYVLWLSQAPS